MTGKKASPMTRPCAVCQTSFRPRRSDAEFCSNRCRQANHRKGNPSLSIAQNAFPVDLERAELATAATISRLNELAAPLGVIFTYTKRTFDVTDIIPGAADNVETHDQGPIGQFLRLLRADGWFSLKTQVREALVERTYRLRNKAILSDTKAVFDRDHADWRRISDLKRLQDSILKGDAWLDSAIRPLIEHKGIPVGAPSVMPAPAPRPNLQAAPFEPPDPMPLKANDPPRKTSKRWRYG